MDEIDENPPVEVGAGRIEQPRHGIAGEGFPGVFDAAVFQSLPFRRCCIV
jgi:hypothetical protein